MYARTWRLTRRRPADGNNNAHIVAMLTFSTIRVDHAGRVLYGRMEFEVLEWTLHADEHEEEATLRVAPCYPPTVY